MRVSGITEQPIEKLLNRLQSVREVGADQWVACCPAHEDATPSCSIRQSDDGMLLLHCFAGCETEAILDAVGLSFSDLYPEPLPDTPQRRYWKARRPRLDGWTAVRAIEINLTRLTAAIEPASI